MARAKAGMDKIRRMPSRIGDWMIEDME